MAGLASPALLCNEWFCCVGMHTGHPCDAEGVDSPQVSEGGSAAAATAEQSPPGQQQQQGDMAGSDPAERLPLASVLCEPRSLLIFKDEAYTGCLHGIDFTEAEHIDASTVSGSAAGALLG